MIPRIPGKLSGIATVQSQYAYGRMPKNLPQEGRARDFLESYLTVPLAGSNQGIH